MGLQSIGIFCYLYNGRIRNKIHISGTCVRISGEWFLLQIQAKKYANTCKAKTGERKTGEQIRTSGQNRRKRHFSGV